MKQLLTALLVMVCLMGAGQKISKNNYGTVDTVIQYNNATVVIYKVKEKVVRDTIFTSVTINEVDYMLITGEILIRRKRKQ